VKEQLAKLLGTSANRALANGSGSATTSGAQVTVGGDLRWRCQLISMVHDGW
jgi:hypothetical protein